MKVRITIKSKPKTSIVWKNDFDMEFGENMDVVYIVKHGERVVDDYIFRE